MMIRWPLAKWTKGVGLTSATRREAVLSGRISDANSTSLGELRRFVASVERWPDSACVTKHSGAVIGVEFFERADPLMPEPVGSRQEATK